MKYFYKTILLIVFVVAAQVVQQGSVGAETFPDSNNYTPPSAGISAMVSRVGGGVTLDATRSEIEVSNRDGANVTVTIENACQYDNPLNDVGDMSMQVTIAGSVPRQNGWPGVSGQCSGGNIVFNNVTLNSDPIYGGQRYTRSVVIEKTGGSGIKSFRVTVTGGTSPKASFRADQDYTNNTVPTLGGVNDAFSVWAATPTGAARNGSATADISFTFKPDCRYTSGDSVWFKWFDADQGEPNQPSSLSFSITSISGPGSDPVPSATVLGGNGDYRSIQRTLNANTTYRWTWNNVNTNNGIQLWLPFSENARDVNCSSPAPPSVTVNATCLPSGAMRVSGRITNTPQKAWNYKIFFNPPMSSLPGASTDAAGNYSQDKIANFTSAQSGFVRVYSGVIGSAPEIPDKPFSTPPCPGTGVDTPPTFNPEVRCDGVAVHNLQDAQDGGPGVRIYGQFFHRYVDGAGVESFAPVPGPSGVFDYDDQPAETFVAWPEGIEDGINQGWALHIGAYNVYNSTGNDNNPKIYYSAEAEGACYQATCDTPDVLEPAGFPANSVKANEPFNVNVTVNNPPNNVAVSAYYAPTNPNRTPSSPGAWDLAGVSFTPTNPIKPWYPRVPPLVSGAFSTSINPGAPWGPNPSFGYDFEENPLGSSIAWNSSQTATQTYNAPNDRDNHTLQMYPDFRDVMQIGPFCSTPVVTYLSYEFTANASTALQPDTENPAQAKFTTGITKSSGVNVEGTATRAYYKETPPTITGISATSQSSPNPDVAPPAAEFGNRSYTDYLAPVGVVQLGDRFCVSVTLDRGKGWRGPDRPGIDDYVNERTAFATDCATPPICPVAGTCGPAPAIPNHPYFRVYGGDVVAGGGFGASCTASGAGILGYMRPISEQKPDDGTPQSNKSGSGAQLAAMALDEISGFTSASLRTIPPVLPRDLTFASNSPISGSNPLRPVLGGYMAGGGWCAPDYFAQTQYPDADTVNKDVQNGPSALSPITIPSLPDKQQTLRNIAGGKLRINGSNNYDRHHAVYVDGDVFIRDNIAYKTDYSGGITTIPSFALIVKGDIYIDKDVTQLDGLYIAQPRPFDANGDGDTDDPGDFEKGRIYTCATDSGDVPITDPSGLFFQCGASATEASCSAGFSQLTVNGAFIANKIILNRTGHTLRCSTFRELPSASKAAEVFNFNPELWLSPPYFSPRSTATSGTYDYISTLPPIL